MELPKLGKEQGLQRVMLARELVISSPWAPTVSRLAQKRNEEKMQQGKKTEVTTVFPTLSLCHPSPTLSWMWGLKPIHSPSPLKY